MYSIPSDAVKACVCASHAAGAVSMIQKVLLSLDCHE